MKKILLIVITALIAVSTGLSLEPMKIGFVYTAGTPTSVQVQLADNTSSNLFQGENYTTGITPNSSGVIVVNVRDHAGSGTTWADYQASNVNTYSTLDIYVNGTLYAQYRLDALILAQAQNGILDQDGNLTPPESGSGNIGTDELRWNSAYFEGNTVHIGPADGEAGDTEMRLSYNDATNTGSIAIDDEDIIDATSDLVTINKLVSQVIAGNNTAFGNTAFNGTSTGASNTAIGYLSLSANTNGNNNTAVGTSSLRNNTSGAQNTAVGVDALIANTSGISNTAVGYLSLTANNANNNSAFGTSTLRNNTTGSNNTAVGESALSANTTGSTNTAVGRFAMGSNQTGTANTAMGFGALQDGTTNSDNTAFGYGALNNNTANDNTAMGTNSLNTNTTGSRNVAIGKESMQFNTTGVTNVAIGTEAMKNNETGSANTVVGHNSFYYNTDGSFNSAFGYQALLFNTTGIENTAIGYHALQDNTTGLANTALGKEAMRENTTGIYNTAIGIRAFENATNESNSVGVGNRAGASLVSGGFGNVFLGTNAGSNALQKTDAENSIAIGVNTHTTANNQVVIGNSSITETQLRGATLVDLAGGGTQNIQVDNNGKLVASSTVSVHFSATAPTSPIQGTLWYDSANSLLKIWDGATWQNI